MARAWTKTRKRQSLTRMMEASKRVPAEQKAFYHSVSGAGRSHVRRDFFDLADDDVDAIVARVRAYWAHAT